jgi:hypothetical protein
MLRDAANILLIGGVTKLLQVLFAEFKKQDIFQQP